jgi:Flp pilus assembly protein TadD
MTNGYTVYFGNQSVAPDSAASAPGYDDAADTAVALARRGQLAEAERSFESRVRQFPQDPVVHHNYAVFLAEQKRAKEATEHFQTALRLRPDYVEASRNLGTLLCTQKRYHEALGCLWTGVSRRPQDVQLLWTLGTTLMSARQSAAAIPVFLQACRFAPKDPIAFNQLGLAHFDAGRFEQAEEAFLRALDLDPKLPSAHNNLGSLYKAMGRTREAFSCFELALTLDPGSQKTRWNRALTLLAAGEMERGWEAYESRWDSPDTPPRKLPQPLWQGESLENCTILLYAEQGLGDTIQFIRYAPLLKQRGAKVIFECPSPLAGVLKHAQGIDQMVPQEQPLPPFDVHAPLIGLPRHFQTTLERIPAKVPYIHAEAARIEYWRYRLQELKRAGDLLVGISWQGNPHHQWDHFRSVPLMSFEPLTRIIGVRLVSLQRGPGIEQIDVFNRLTDDKLLVPTDGQQTTPEHLADTAALMSNLDLVLSVDTAPAHLAGALGIPVWVALSYVADWRWLLDRQDSPWYPTMRLFRQKTFGDWGELFGRIAVQIEHTHSLKAKESGRGELR